MSDTPSPPSPRRPVPVAVALKLEAPGEGLPQVVAQGRGWVAERILDLAFAHGIKVRQDADLAEILATVDVASDIPAEAVVAVAEILIKVYQANGRLAGFSDDTP